MTNCYPHYTLVLNYIEMLVLRDIQEQKSQLAVKG